MAPGDSLSNVRKCVLPNPNATCRLAYALAADLVCSDVICLSGELGVGKTTFARDLIHALGCGDEEVLSPTFNLVQVYALPPLTVWHFDLYRILHVDEVYELGFEEALTEGISLIEWPDRLRELMPLDRLDLTLESDVNSETRVAFLLGHGSWKQRLQSLSLDD